jgi:hypothetical protein
VTALDENPNCEKTYASFRLGGDHLVPEAIERATGLASDFAAAKGDLRRSSSGHELRQGTGVWFVTSEGRVESKSIERHLVYLLAMVEPVREQLLAIAREQSLTADFFCYWASATGHGGPQVGADTLMRISELQASLGFDFYG